MGRDAHARQPMGRDAHAHIAINRYEIATLHQPRLREAASVRRIVANTSWDTV
jgi:hypothetical protein